MKTGLDDKESVPWIGEGKSRRDFSSDFEVGNFGASNAD